MITKAIITSHLNYAKNKGWLPHYQEAASFYDIPVEILLGKDSRETWLGSIPGLQANGWKGSDGISVGISQVNVKEHPFARVSDPNDVRANIALGAQILRQELDTFNGNYKNALAAYNTGQGRVEKALANNQDPDVYTTDGDYGADILNRAQLIREVLQENTFPIKASTANLGGNSILFVLLLASGAYYLWRANK